MRAAVRTAGTRVGIECQLPWVAQLLAECCGDELRPDPAQGVDAADVSIRIESSHVPFDISGLVPLSRSAWSGSGELVMRDVCTSGFDLRLRMVAGNPVLTYRWRPPPSTRTAAIALRARFHLLTRAALLQYPAMWWASTRGAVPLHVAVLSDGGMSMLLAGPAGVGKTTLLMRELRQGGVATSDNLCVSDGHECWGVVEPVRIEGITGRRMTHGRRETRLPARVESLIPDVVVLLRRSADGSLAVRRCSSSDAVRSLAGGTYMAGELRRYWAFAATLSTATGVGPVHPAVVETSAILSRHLSCLEVCIPANCELRLHEVLEVAESSTCA
jgi:hypothetical protein